MANITNLANLKRHLATFSNIIKIEVLEKEKSKRAIFITSDKNPESSLFDFLEMQNENDVTRFQPVYIKLFFKHPKSTNEAGTDPVGFTFVLEDRSNSYKQPGTTGTPNQETYFNLGSELGYLRAEINRLNDIIKDQEEVIEEFEQEAETREQNELSGPPTNQIENIIGYIETAKNLFPGIANLLNGTKTIAEPDQDQELTNIIAELKMIDPQFKLRMKEYLHTIKQTTTNGQGNKTGNN